MEKAATKPTATTGSTVATSTIATTQNQNKPIMDYPELASLEQHNGTSFYLLDVQRLRNNYRKIQNAFQSRYENFIIGYSFKTNYLPYLCKQLLKLGAYAEVVSRLEYDLAIKIGADPQKIIFNGPIKTKDDIHHALHNQSIINIDSLYEMQHIQEHCNQNPTDTFRIGIRVNFDISTNGISPLVEGYETSRFGICAKNGSLNEAIEELTRIPNLRIAGLHGHFSTTHRSPETYAKITQSLCYIVNDFDLQDIEYIDIGGGIFGEVPKSLIPNVPTFDDYAEAVCPIMKEAFSHTSEKPALILEPGISMVANTLIFVAKVIGTKKIRHRHFVLVDGSVHNIKPTMHKKNLPMKVVKPATDPVTADPDPSSAQPMQVEPDACEPAPCVEPGVAPTTYHIVGYTCLEKDYLATEVIGNIPEIGDYILFENVGAYTIVFSPSFIKEKPAIIAHGDGPPIVVRKKETIHEFFNEALYLF